MGYDAEDDVIAVTNAAGVLVTNLYDGAGRVLVRGYPDGGVEKWKYDANGFVGPVVYTNQLGKLTTWAYDALQRLTNETAVGVYTNKFVYSRADDLRELRDGLNQLTSWGYDAEGRLTSKTNAAGVTIVAYAYDANGRMTNRVTPAKGTTKYTYDGVGNLTFVNHSSDPTVSFGYDALSRLTNMSGGRGYTLPSVFSYDPMGQLQSEDGPWPSDTVTYGYGAGRRMSLTLAQPYSTAWVQTYDYDTAGRLESITSPAGFFEYLLGGGTGSSAASELVKRLTFNGGAYITNTYDNVARLSATILRNSGHATISSHGYLVNQGNQRYRQTFTAGNLIDYTYDDIGQLKTAHGNESGEETPYEHYTFGYGYDAAGNLRQRTNNLLVQTFTANALNQLSNVTRSGTLTVGGMTTIPATVTVNGQTAATYSDNSFSRAGFTLTNGNNTFTAVAADANGRGDTNSVMVHLPATVAFTYDANGNLTSDGRRGFDYDDENQLVCVTVTNDWKSEFVYDGLLRRRIARDYTWRNSTWVQTSETRYVYDGLLPIQERDRFNVPLHPQEFQTV